MQTHNYYGDIFQIALNLYESRLHSQLVMNNLPPLPLIDGCLFIDNSGWIESLTTCHRLTQYKSLSLRIGAAEKPALNFGSVIHLCLEHRYRKYRTDAVGPNFFNEIGEIITKFFDEHPCPIDDWRNANWAMKVMKQYMAKYETEDFALLGGKDGEPMVELPFAIELYRHLFDGNMTGKIIPVIYTGRIDLPLSLPDSSIWVNDNKTTGLIGAQHWDKMRMSSQLKGYCWSFEQLTGKKVSGYMVNTIRTKEPPDYVLRGETSSRGKKQSPEAWWDESFQRERFYLQPGALDEWKKNTIAIVEEFFYNYQKGYLPMETSLGCTAYGRCPYFDVCTLPESDRDVLLSSGMYTDNVWSPLHQPTQAKQ